MHFVSSVISFSSLCLRASGNDKALGQRALSLLCGMIAAVGSYKKRPCRASFPALDLTFR